MATAEQGPADGDHVEQPVEEADWRDVRASGGIAAEVAAMGLKREMHIRSGASGAGGIPGANYAKIFDHLEGTRTEVGEFLGEDGERWRFHTDLTAPQLFGRSITLRFDDRSTLIMPFESTRGHALDEGQALLQPITIDEYQDVERALQVLWEAVEEGDLQDHHRLQLRCLVELLADDHRDTVPGETKRHKLVGTMRTLARFSTKPEISGAFAWWKIGELLVGTNWPNVARIFLDAASKAAG